MFCERFSPAPSCDLTKRDTLKSCLYRGGRHALHRMRTLMSPMCPSGVRTDQVYLLSLSLQITVITRLAVEVYFLRALCVSHRSPAPTDRPAPAWSRNHSAPITGDAREPRPSHESHIKTNSFLINWFSLEQVLFEKDNKSNFLTWKTFRESTVLSSEIDQNKFSFRPERFRS